MPEHFYFRLIHRDIDKRMIQCRALHIMACIMMVIYSLQFFNDISNNWIQLLTILPPALLVMSMAIFKRKLVTEVNNNRIFRILESGILLMACMGYLKADQFFPAFLFGLLALFLMYILFVENRLFTHQFIDITKAGVSIALPTHNRKTTWSQISNIVVKDAYFTLETAGGEIWQYPVYNSLTPEESEQFVVFCDRNKTQP